MKNPKFKLADRALTPKNEELWVVGMAPNGKGEWIYALSATSMGNRRYFKESDLLPLNAPKI